MSQKKSQAEDYGGPFTTAREVDQLMSSLQTEKKIKQILKAELAIQKERYKCSGVTSGLFALNKLTNLQLAQNLKKILKGEVN